MSRTLLRIGLAAAALCVVASASAHKPSDSYLRILIVDNAATLDIQWDIALRDLDLAVGLDADSNREITWSEVRAQQSAIAQYALSKLRIAAGGQPCVNVEPAADALLVDRHSDGGYAVLRFQARCAAVPRQLDIRYDLLFERDPSHRGLLELTANAITHSAVFAPDDADFHFDLAQATPWRQLGNTVYEGIWHIWLGFDHVLFLLCLLLPAVLIRSDRQWQPAPALKGALWRVVAIVSAFTLAHSITLSLAVLGVIALPSRPVESAIALSVLLAALNNVRPLVSERAWMIAFGFGLIHGFGFASALKDLGLPREALALSLIGFNAGVEFGQLAIVALVIPLAFVLRRSGFYRRGVLVIGSLLVAAIAAVWLVERLFDLRILPAGS